MSAHAYSAASRRHARYYVRDLAVEQRALPRKKADVVVLVPRQQKLGELTPPKQHRGSFLLALLLVGAAHLAVAWQLLSQPEPVITKAEIPPMTVEFYRPPVEQPPQPEQPKEEPPPPKPEPVVEKPKPVVKKEPPKPVEKKPEPVQDVIVPEPVPAPPPPPAEPVLTKATADAGYLRNPAPRYPDFAQQQGWEGTVLLNVHVLANGKPKAVEIKQSSGRKILDDSAVQAVKRWTFVPAKLGETATDSWVEVPIDFRLAN
ncbi:energy transducer TonB [Cellvibrio japonicus]|uniref:TonB protein n=1 Tax=Cellvibrio japonicus (strain Ueda107) TaxID=498211 RepID=B3PJW5_CELJU|nr:energy transducer TonB [Cellvibrio japonicus]ACE83985.1 tonB protein [Cellvibrio japonicus Ueda107]QEI12742.1 energy transducer TonB [Cellvibrio japonicus]QEI16316.1 energy transducer TonB [Cellvibrio japonicus]QEI19894.1 energy transducer TonB [Cellvibrio japonicus]